MGLLRRVYRKVKRTLRPQSPDNNPIQKWKEMFENRDRLTVDVGNGLKVYGYKGSEIGRRLYFGGFEETERVFTKRYLRAGDTFFDIGANIGIFSLEGSQIVGSTGKVYSFEPTPTTFKWMSENIELNGLKNVKAEQIALSNENGTASFFISDDTNNSRDARNSLADTFTTKNRRHTHVDVKTETLDSYVKRMSVGKIAIMKIDVEGWESFVLDGGKEVLSADNAPVILIEFNDDNAVAANSSCKELYKKLEQLGYTLYEYDDKNDTLIKEECKDYYGYENKVCIKPAHKGMFKFQGE